MKKKKDIHYDTFTMLPITVLDDDHCSRYCIHMMEQCGNEGVIGAHCSLFRVPLVLMPDTKRFVRYYRCRQGLPKTARRDVR